MSDEILVSLIIPVYNTGEYLVECLDSCIRQTLSNIEIICVDDGSTDDSLKILNEYSKKDNRVRVFAQKNSGQSVARNKGMKLAEGKYIAFLDSDDSLNPCMLEKLYNQANADNADITMCSINVVNEKTECCTKTDSYFSLDIIPKEFEHKTFNWKDVRDFIFRIPVTPWNKLYKRSFLKYEKIKFLEKITFEDNIFFLEAFLSAKRVNFLREALVNYRYFSKTSYSTNHGKNDYKKLDFFKIFKVEEKILRSKKIYNELRTDFLAYKKYTLINWFEKISDKRVKLLYAIKLYLLYPELFFEKALWHFRKQNIIKKLNMITKDKRIMFRGASKILEEILKSKSLKNKKNILGIIDKNESRIGDNIEGIEIFGYDILRKIDVDELVLSVLNVCNFEKIVKNELKNENLNIEINYTTF
ncbi:glycosyltransferase [bacterium]|nr:glycosyltransferase [bacterium]